MTMSEDILKVELSPATGQYHGTFTEGRPIAEAIGMVAGFQVDLKNGSRIIVYGMILGVQDELLNIDNRKSSAKQVVKTTIYMEGMTPVSITWAAVAVAVAEIAAHLES